MPVEIYESVKINQLGGKFITTSELKFKDKFFSRTVSYADSWRECAISICEEYIRNGRQCLLVHSQGMLTIWREDNNNIPIIPLTKPIVIGHIEDNPMECKLMSKYLEGLNCSYQSFYNATLAVPFLLKLNPDLIFLDLNMPVVNGYEICTQLKRIPKFKQTPIVILTANDGLIDRARASMVGASDFLAKPIDREKLNKLVTKNSN